jgi:hypothetical protein
MTHIGGRELVVAHHRSGGGRRSTGQGGGWCARGPQGGVAFTRRGLEELGTGACAVEEEDDGAGVVAVIPYSRRRRLGNVIGSKASRGRTGTMASVLEAEERRACRRSGGACGEAEAVPSEERGAEQGLGFMDSLLAAGSGREVHMGAVASTVTTLRKLAADDRATMVLPRTWTRAGRDMRSRAIVDRWQAGPTT